MNAIAIPQQTNSMTSVEKGQKSTIVALRLDAGESLLLGHPRCPESKSLVQGQHFEYLPPYKGRGDYLAGHMDPTGCARFTALVPLLLAVKDLWPTTGKYAERGCRAITHMRMARIGGSFDIGGEAAIESEFRLRLGAKESGYPEHIIQGGPLQAAIYSDECVIPAYRWDQRQDLPFAYIVDRQDLELVRSAFSTGSQLSRQAKAGEPTKLKGIQSASTHHIKVLGPTTLRYDKVGRIHGIEQVSVDEFTGKEEVKIKTFTVFKNGIRVRVGEMVTDNRLRAALEIELLPVVAGHGTTVPTVSPAITLAAGCKTGGLLDSVRTGPPAPIKAAAPKVVPTAVRRTAAPKITDLPPAPVEEVIAEAVDAVETPQPTSPWLNPEAMAAALAAIQEREKPTAVVEAENPLIALLMEEFDGHPLPDLATASGRAICSEGAAMTEIIAGELIQMNEEGEYLLMHPGLVDFMPRFFGVLELQG